MDSLQSVLSGSKERDIYAIAQYIEGHIAENWQTLIQKNIDMLLNIFTRSDDMAYKAYFNLLFRPVHKQLKQEGLFASPRLPGDINISREWGTEEENNRQRWAWSTINSAEGEPLGSIVTIMFHEHPQFCIPRQPQIIALTETSKEAVVEVLSDRSADFKNAPEAWIEIEEYMLRLQSQGFR